MRKLVSFFAAITLMANVAFAGNSVPVSFNESIDLVTLVFHLSGAQEFNNIQYPAYQAELESHFAKMSGHKAVQLAGDYHSKGVSYDAVASFGYHFDISDNGTLAFNRKFKEGSDTSFDRWSESQKAEFLSALQDFYRESDFHSWYLSTEESRNAALAAFDNIKGMIDFDWFDSFFGKLDDARFEITLSILDGYNNYGISGESPEGEALLLPVISVGDPKNPKAYDANSCLPIVIHEFCHAYCNPLTDRYWDNLERKADEIFPYSEKILSAQAYPNSKIMMYESFVRASVIRYMLSHDPEAKMVPLVLAEENNGFIMTQHIVNQLGQYENSHDQYPDMESFMADLAQSYRSFTIEGYKAHKKQQEKNFAKVTCNIKDNQKNVPSGELTMTFTFSKPMATEGISMNLTEDAAFPEFLGFSWSADKTVLSVKFNTQPSTRYGIDFLGGMYLTKSGYPAEAKVIYFTTK